MANSALVKKSLVNTGTINVSQSTGLGIRLQGGTTIEGDIYNSGTMNAGVEFLDASNLHGDLINTGTITQKGSGIKLVGSTIGGTLRNAGTINSSTMGGYGISLEGSTSVGAVENSGTITTGVYVAGATVAGGIVNTGSISDEGSSADFGIKITSSSTVGKIENEGVVSGSNFSLWVDGYADDITIRGTEARLVGDVMAGQAMLVLASGSEFTTENAFFVRGVTVEDGATLILNDQASSSGSIQSGTFASSGVANAGIIVVPAGTRAMIRGDYTQTGALQVGANSAADYGQLEVTGTATVGNDMKIIVDVSTGNTLLEGDALSDILTAGTLVGANSFTVTDTSYLFDFEATRDGNTVDLSVTLPPAPVDPTEPEDPSTMGGTVSGATRGEGNLPAGGAARVMDDLIDRFVSNGTSGNPEMDRVIGQLGTLGNRKQVSDAASQMLPAHHGGPSRVIGGTIRGTSQSVQARLGGQGGQSSGEALLEDRHFWAKPFGSWTDQSDRSGVSGYSATSYGMVFGADAEVADSTRLGLAFSYANSNVDGNSNVAPQNMSVDSYQLTAYGAYALTGATQLDLQADMGLHQNDGSRHIGFMGQSAKADYNSWSGHVGAGVTHRLDIAEGTRLTPGLRADYTRIHDQSYRESGAGALNLRVDDNRTSAFLVTLETGFEQDLTDRVTLTANAGVSYDMINDRASITSAFAGAPGANFTTQGIDPSPWIGHGGLGLDAKLTDTMTLSVNYDLEVREDFNSQSASAKLRWAF
ncbi:autotransporter outer membrane beta-barrel domain-containing protein [Sneathiella chinensis]|uniref:Autotransporter domain-containing protein n=1 Tax=Sneathiella chinensis TaxID=349750 RepID=A0ABQ5U4Y7_9PROT|nr:autotransporter outer membrane beta-barrel domain-containing protein [Sneathiella chinensis]GLQ07230.1 hypothetical protein GCM10007924_24510 [Sneathiella chinensis]